LTRKILAISNPGDTTHYGTDDIDYINSYLTGVDQSGTDPVTINTTTTYASSKLNLKAPTTGNTFSIITSDVVGNRTVTFPLLTGNDTFAMVAFANTFTGSNTFSGVTTHSGAITCTAGATFNTTDITLGAGVDFVLDTVTGSRIGLASTQKLGFYGVTAIVQPAAITAPSGGTTIDTQARTAISSLITTLHNLGLTA